MLDQIKIASPCSANWEQMEGTDRIRFCSECKKNVYNLSALPRRDAEALLRQTNGDICARLYRRTDGTVLTEDCPVGLRAKISRVRRRIGWAVSAAFGLSTAFAQQGDSLGGVVSDPTGAGLPRATIAIVNDRTGAKIEIKSDDKGHFKVTDLNRDSYTVIVSFPGFATSTKRDIDLQGEVEVPFMLQIATSSMGGPIVSSAPKP